MDGARSRAVFKPSTRQMKAIESNAQLPRHRHVGNELRFIIERAISDEFGTVTAGNVGYSPSPPRRPAATVPSKG
jgi:anti-sigma factor ChrR (cupin superfamily)